MAGDEASLEVARTGSTCNFTGVLSLFQKSCQGNVEYGTGLLGSRVKRRSAFERGEDVYKAGSRDWTSKVCEEESVHLAVSDAVLKSVDPGALRRACFTAWQAESRKCTWIDLTVRTAMCCAAPSKEASAPADPRRPERI